MAHKQDWADKIASSTSHMRLQGGKVRKWDYEEPSCTWESMPFFVRWPLALAFIVYLGGSFISVIALILKGAP